MRVSGGQPRSRHDQCRPCDETHVLEYAGPERLLEPKAALEASVKLLPSQSRHLSRRSAI
jgi:hypothetical protein